MFAPFVWRLPVTTAFTFLYVNTWMCLDVLALFTDQLEKPCELVWVQIHRQEHLSHSSQHFSVSRQLAIVNLSLNLYLDNTAKEAAFCFSRAYTALNNQGLLTIYIPVSLFQLLISLPHLNH